MWVACAGTLNQGDELQSYYTMNNYRIYLKITKNPKTNILWVTRFEVFKQRLNIEILNEIERFKENIIIDWKRFRHRKYIMMYLQEQFYQSALKIKQEISGDRKCSTSSKVSLSQVYKIFIRGTNKCRL